MKHRISTGVLLFKDDKILLVKHVDPKSHIEWWVPPGGGLEGEETVLEAAKREVWEESGLDAKIGQLAYVRQLLLFDYNMLELFFWGGEFSGDIHIKNIVGKGEDEDFIKEVKWFSQKELQNIMVRPDIIKGQMWKDRENSPPAYFIGQDKAFLE